MPYLGESAALGAAVCWAMTAIAYSKAGRDLGSEAVNGSRLLHAVFFLSSHMLISGVGPWPWEMDSYPLFMLSLSGLIGLALGDAALFHSYLIIGPRLGMLMMSLWPAVAAVLGFFVLGEKLSTGSIIGMTLTMGSVTWVALERRRKDECEPVEEVVSSCPSPDDKEALSEDGTSSRMRLFGFVCALVGVLGQAIGIVVAKVAMLGSAELGLKPVDPLAATLTRMLVATIAIWAVILLRGKGGPICRGLLFGGRLKIMIFGSFVGPFIGVWLSLVAGLKTELGIAGTLMATSPIWVIPLSIIFEKETVSIRAWVGAVVAFVGVSLLFVS
ncbi:MAG: DMT family transporter [Planctomycetota bacterium]|nr:DMT family transporter [Planctomycetota bacterium]